MTVQPKQPEWKPSFKWHLKALAAAALSVVFLFIALKAAFYLLPETFSPKTPVKQTTPWLKE